MWLCGSCCWKVVSSHASQLGMPWHLLWIIQSGSISHLQPICSSSLPCLCLNHKDKPREAYWKMSDSRRQSQVTPVKATLDHPVKPPTDCRHLASPAEITWAWLTEQNNPSTYSLGGEECYFCKWCVAVSSRLPMIINTLNQNICDQSSVRGDLTRCGPINNLLWREGRGSQACQWSKDLHKALPFPELRWEVNNRPKRDSSVMQLFLGSSPQRLGTRSWSEVTHTSVSIPNELIVFQGLAWMELNLCWNGQLFREGTQTLKQELGPFFFFFKFGRRFFFY